MPVEWSMASEIIMGGVGKSQKISPTDAQRQAKTAREILERLRVQPGVLLADEVGMGKTYVAMAVIASVIVSTKRTHGPVVVMMPPGLRQKWQRDWEQFKTHCVRNHALDWVRDEYARRPTEFFKLLDDRADRRTNLVFITTSCFSRGLNDPWVKLAMIRLARSKTELRDTQKRRLYRWAPELVREFSRSQLTENLTRHLMHSDVLAWKRLLVKANILTEEDDDPIPEELLRDAHRIDWTALCDILRELPGWRPESVKPSHRKQMRQEFRNACHNAYKQWLNLADWRSPLLVLDEAHHAKNDTTRLAQLFRQESEDNVALLRDKFDRMLFLTATPFQLGHQELIRVLRSFVAVRWSSQEAPAGSREEFMAAMTKLEQALDCNRLAARRFDQYWGKLRANMLDSNEQAEEEEKRVLQWWKRVTAGPRDAWEQRLVQAYQDCLKTKEDAEGLLKPWLIRHNRSSNLPGTDTPRRKVLVGRAIRNSDASSAPQVVEGLPIHERAWLPFLITAKA